VLLRFSPRDGGGWVRDSNSRIPVERRDLEIMANVRLGEGTRKRTTRFAFAKTAHAIATKESRYARAVLVIVLHDVSRAVKCRAVVTMTGIRVLWLTPEVGVR
jgi:hypothetical protein